MDLFDKPRLRKLLAVLSTGVYITDALAPIDDAAEAGLPATIRQKTDFVFVGSDGEFSGYAYKWGYVVEGQQIDPGAFTESLEKRWPKMLWDHNSSEPIGKWLEIVEDDIGLFVRGQLNLDVEKAREIASLMKDRAVDGLSVAYFVVEQTGQVGEIHYRKIQLYEISLCTFPAVESALVDSVSLTDALVVDASSVRTTNDGYVVAFARAARTGLQLYKGSEVGRPELDIVKVYRPEKEVFATDSLRSYGHKPVTNDHPPEPVSPINWSKYARGIVDGEVLRDGDFVRVPLMLTDSATIEDFKAGKRELSLGYTTDIVWGEGKTPKGETYDAIQTNIRANHLAVVSVARGGDKLRIGDTTPTDPSSKGDKPMNTRTLTVDGLSCDVSEHAAQIMQRALNDRQSIIDSTAEALKKAKEKVAELEAKMKEEGEKSAKDSAEAVAKISALEKQVADSALTPAKLDQLVKDRQVVIDSAKKLVASIVTDGKTEAEIRRQVVDAQLKDKAKGWSDDQVKTAFDTLSSMAPASSGHGHGGAPIYDNLGADLVSDSLLNDVDKAYAERDQLLRDAWRQPDQKVA
jgi:HK97 family phage prohead protease